MTDDLLKRSTLLPETPLVTEAWRVIHATPSRERFQRIDEFWAFRARMQAHNRSILG